MIVGEAIFKDVDVEPVWRVYAHEEHWTVPPEWTPRVSSPGACPGTAEQQTSSSSPRAQTGGTRPSAACWKKPPQAVGQTEKGEKEDGGKKETEHCGW